ncbi:MAG: diguanylate cyclase [Caldimicrobium sp.]
MKRIIIKIKDFLVNRSLFWKTGFIVGLWAIINVALSLYYLRVLLEISANPQKVQLHIEFLKELFYLVFLLQLIFLIWGGLVFWFFIKKPLNKINSNLENLIYNPEGIDKSKLLRIPFKDEIGNVIEKVNTILLNFKDMQIFKHVIENDESIEDIYERLGEQIKRLSFVSFVIYEVSNSQNTMRPVFKSDEEIEVNSEKLFNADKCRAKRTGKIVTSLEASHVCKLYEYIDITHHYCIPILAGNKVLGIVEIHLPMTEETLATKKFREKLVLLQKYIDETAPVIESRRYAEALKEQTYKDSLTNLHNRRFFEGIIDNLTAQILRRGTVLGILMCDLDYFKSINDKYGHEVGDLVLKELGQVLSNNVRKSDLVIRFGGEEFLVLLIDVRAGEGEKVAETLRRAVEMHEFKTPKGIIKRTISIGVAEFPTDTSAIWEAIKFADIALYKAKEAGRNKVVRFTKEFWPEEEY